MLGDLVRLLGNNCQIWETLKLTQEPNQRICNQEVEIKRKKKEEEKEEEEEDEEKEYIFVCVNYLCV